MLSITEIQNFLADNFPRNGLTILTVKDNKSSIRKSICKNDLRPGGTVSGPSLMALVDAAIYITILGNTDAGERAVTTNININFLRKPPGNTDIAAHCELIKLGKSLIVGEVELYSEGLEKPIAHATGTYAIPSP